MTHAAVKIATSSLPQILVCDDDTEFSSELVEALKAKGYNASALLTVSAVRASILSPSIILLDLCMPQRNGVEIMTLLAEHPRKDHFKIILMSGFSEQTLEAAAMLCQTKGLALLGTLRKPVALRALCDLLDKHPPDQGR
jgi:CheY-like chemotaxis protein